LGTVSCARQTSRSARWKEVSKVNMGQTRTSAAHGNTPLNPLSRGDLKCPVASVSIYVIPAKAGIHPLERKERKNVVDNKKFENYHSEQTSK